MVKKSFFTFILLFAYYANANNLLQDKIINLIEKEDYIIHKDFISILFKNEDKFFDGHNINIIKIIETLQENGLFKFIFKEPVNMNISFETKNTESVLMSIKSIQDAMYAIGYGFFITTQAQYSNILKWSISFKTNVGIEPILLNNELNKRGIIITDIIKHQKTRWTYKINVDNIRLSDVHKIKKYQTIKIKQRISDIFIQPMGLSNKYSKITITSNAKNTWYPYIVFYDKKLNILKIKKIDKIIKKISIQIPLGSYYIKLSDIYINKNFNSGFSVLIQ